MNEYSKRIGSALQTERKQAGIALRDMEKRLKVDNSTISKWETGTNKISVVDLLRYLKECNVTPEEFFKKNDIK